MKLSYKHEFETGCVGLGFELRDIAHHIFEELSSTRNMAAKRFVHQSNLESHLNFEIYKMKYIILTVLFKGFAEKLVNICLDKVI